MTTNEKMMKHDENANRAISKAPTSSTVDEGCLMRLGDVGQPCGARVASLGLRRGVTIDTGSCLTDNVDWVAS
jgi:hypothetical protein